METVRANERMPPAPSESAAIEMADRVGIPSDTKRIKTIRHQPPALARPGVMIACSWPAGPNCSSPRSPPTALGMSHQRR